MVISCHVIGINIGDHCHQRGKMQKRTIAFVGFGNKIKARSKLCATKGRQKTTPNDVGWIKSCFGEYKSNKAGRCCLAMCAGYGDAAF